MSQGDKPRIEDAIERILEVTGRDEGEAVDLVVKVAAYQPSLGYITYRTKSGMVTSAFGDLTKGIFVPPRATVLAAGLVGPNTPQPPTVTLGHSIGTLRDPG